MTEKFMNPQTDEELVEALDLAEEIEEIAEEVTKEITQKDIGRVMLTEVEEIVRNMNASLHSIKSGYYRIMFLEIMRRLCAKIKLTEVVVLEGAMKAEGFNKQKIRHTFDELEKSARKCTFQLKQGGKTVIDENVEKAYGGE